MEFGRNVGLLKGLFFSLWKVINRKKGTLRGIFGVILELKMASWKWVTSLLENDFRSENNLNILVNQKLVSGNLCSRSSIRWSLSKELWRLLRPVFAGLDR